MRKRHWKTNNSGLSPIILLLCVIPCPALAKAYLVSSVPAENETVTEAPKQVELIFNDHLRTDYLAVSVVDSQGKRVDKRDVLIDDKDQSKIHANLEILIPDSYTLRYRVMGLDALIVTGKYSFTVSTAPPPAPPPAPPARRKKR